MRSDGLRTLEEALVESHSLLNPGEYGISDDDPKIAIIRDVARVTRELDITPVVIGGMAVIVHGYRRTTADVDLLIARADAVRLIRKLEATPGIGKIRIDRFQHLATGRSFDLCVEGELTSPRHSDRFPAPSDVEQVPRTPLPVIGFLDLLALKAKSARAQDEADFIVLTKTQRLTLEDVERVKSKIQDPELRTQVDRWHARALEEIERERLWKPPELE